MDLGSIGKLRLQFSLFLQEAIEKKENQVGNFCDLTKANVAINHDILLSKL
jgi:hypothetical protein